MKHDLLICTPSMSNADYDAKLGPHFNLLYARTPEDQRKVLGEPWLKPVRAIYTTGQHVIIPELIEAMPNLEIVACRGTGYDAIDLDLMREKGLFLSYGAGANAASVADQAMALMLAVMRQVPQRDGAVRQGKWMESRELLPIPTQKRLGIIGMGKVGEGLARRAAGFDMTIAYNTRNKRDDVPYRHYPSVLELARNSDILIACIPGSKETRHIIDAAVLDALGPTGFVVNVARGSVLDTDALVAALREGRLGGAGLDVVDGEPEVPAALLEAPNVVMSPHIGARSPEASDMAFDLAVANLQAHFAGKPLLTPIPGSEGRRRAA